MVDDALVILLAGGAGERLYPLTRDRAKPAVFFGGPYRIIDFTLSNCINSGLRRIFIATQYKSLSLNRHIRMGWSIVSEELGEFVEILPPQKRVSEHWYQGTADAVYQNLYSIVQENPQHVIVLSGDHVYKMDYAKMLRFHKERGAAVTLAAIEIPIQEASRFGVLSVDEQDRVTGFIEKSKNAPSIPGSPDLALGSMGIYIFDTDVLLKALEADAAQPVEPRLRQGHHSRAHHRAADVRLPLLRREQEGVEVLARHRHARRVLRREHGPLRRRSGVQPVRSGMADAHVSAAGAAGEVRVRRKEPARGEALDSIISPGCIISGSRVVGSVLCPNVRVHSYGVIEQSMLMPGVRVGRHARIRRAIIDRDVLIPRGAVIGFNPEEDRKRHTVTDLGVVVVTEDDDPLVEPISEEALRIEAEDDGR